MGTVNQKISLGTICSLFMLVLLIYPVIYASGECTFSISPSPPSYAFGSSGSVGNITITASDDCSWTAASNDAWIIITSGNSGTGNGEVLYNVEQNSTGDGREGSITLDFEAFKVDFVVSQAKGIFTDVTDQNHWAYKYIYAIYKEGITTGCGGGFYCPTNYVTREQMAAFIIRAREGEPPVNYCDSGVPFIDVTADMWSCKYIKRLKELGITTGYPDGRYGPQDLVTREQMAAFIIRALYSEFFSYPIDPYFNDVSSSSWAFKYVQRLKQIGITTQVGTYMASSSVTREQMAAFIARALGMLEVNDKPLTVQPQSLTACIDSRGSHVDPVTLQASGGSPLSGYTWTVTSGSVLPPGITILPLTGVFESSGGTLLEGVYGFSLTVSDGSVAVSAPFTLTVDDLRPNGICPSAVFQQSWSPDIYLPDAIAGKPYGATLYAIGGVPPYSWFLDSSYASNFPLSGLTVDQSGGVVRGTPFSSAGCENFSFRVIVRDNEGNIDVNSQYGGAPVYHIRVRPCLYCSCPNLGE